VGVLRRKRIKRGGMVVIFFDLFRRGRKKAGFQFHPTSQEHLETELRAFIAGATVGKATPPQDYVKDGNEKFNENSRTPV